MRNVKNLALFVLMLALVSTDAVADTHYVNPGDSIQAAILAADPGDEIGVAPGFYTEAIDFSGKAVKLYSTGGPDVTIIDGTGHYHVVQCTSGEGPGTVLEGFTITGGDAKSTGLNGYGGGMYNDNSSPTVTNCTFTGNNAHYGGGMCNMSSSPTVTNCTFTGNTASQGGGMYNTSGSTATLTNCILWDDGPDEIFDKVDSSTTVTYSDVQDGWAGAGNIDADPLFADADGRLSLGSPCINAGSNAAVPPDTADLDGDGDTTEPIPLDLDGNARIFDSVVDMGAYELQETSQEVDFSGWVWMESGGDFGYSLDEDDLLYFLSFGPVWYYNTTTSLWGEEGPVGWTYVNWPYLYESGTTSLMFALPPESGLWVYHFRTSQWTVSPQIIP